MSIFLAFGAMQSSVSLSVLPFCGFRLIMILAPSGETDGYVRAWKKPPFRIEKTAHPVGRYVRRQFRGRCRTGELRILQSLREALL